MHKENEMRATSPKQKHINTLRRQSKIEDDLSRRMRVFYSFHQSTDNGHRSYLQGRYRRLMKE